MLNVANVYPGDYVKLSQIKEGYTQDIIQALNHLKINNVYVIDKIEFHSFYTYFTFIGFPGLKFNSCMFTKTKRKQ